MLAATVQASRDERVRRQQERIRDRGGCVSVLRSTNRRLTRQLIRIFKSDDAVAQPLIARFLSRSAKRQTVAAASPGPPPSKPTSPEEVPSPSPAPPPETAPKKTTRKKTSARAVSPFEAAFKKVIKKIPVSPAPVESKVGDDHAIPAVSPKKTRISLSTNTTPPKGICLTFLYIFIIAHFPSLQLVRPHNR